MIARAATLAAALLLLPQVAVAQPAASADWQLVWSDEFDKPTIDPAKWSLDVDCWGGGNNERQCYTDRPENAAIKDGKLVITARHKRSTGPALPKAMRAQASDPKANSTREFSSAKLTTRGKASWRHGRVEVRASLPQGQGTWPAIWMLPDADAYGRWAASGEIDILEAVNLGVPCASCATGREDTILGTLHFGAPFPGNKQAGSEIHFPQALDGFHDYAIEWLPDRIIWQVDGRTYAERARSEWWSAGSQAPGAPFDREFHLILNLAIGGGLAETRGSRGVSYTGFPKRFVIDWVRVWQKSGGPVTQGSGQSSLGGK